MMMIRVLQAFKDFTLFSVLIIRLGYYCIRMYIEKTRSSEHFLKDMSTRRPQEDPHWQPQTTAPYTTPFTPSSSSYVFPNLKAT